MIASLLLYHISNFLFPPPSPQTHQWSLTNTSYLSTEIKLVTSAIYTNWETRIMDATEENMVPLDGFVGRPRGNRCVLGFRRVDWPGGYACSVSFRLVPFVVAIIATGWYSSRLSQRSSYHSMLYTDILLSRTGSCCLANFCSASLSTPPGRVAWWSLPISDLVYLHPHVTKYMA